ncbi:MAG: choice-of-anchor A family protein [Alphaproteobacteria bacterium]|nr:choice-of-anchor A family protein [Alphaproteobacteria bacterium]
MATPTRRFRDSDTTAIIDTDRQATPTPASTPRGTTPDDTFGRHRLRRDTDDGIDTDRHRPTPTGHAGSTPSAAPSATAATTRHDTDTRSPATRDTGTRFIDTAPRHPGGAPTRTRSPPTPLTPTCPAATPAATPTTSRGEPATPTTPTSDSRLWRHRHRHRHPPRRHDDTDTFPPTPTRHRRTDDRHPTPATPTDRHRGGDTDSDSAADTDSDTTPTDTDTGVDTDTDTLPGDTDSGGDTDTDTLPGDTDSGSDTDSDTTPFDTDSGSDTDSDTTPFDTDSGGDTDSDTVPFDTDSGADSDTDTTPTDTDSGGDTDTLPGDTDSGSDTDSDTIPGDTDSGSDTDTDTLPGDTDSAPDTDSDTTPTDTDSGVDTDTDTLPGDTDSAPDTDSDTTPTDTDSGVDTDTDTDTLPSDTDSAADTDSDTTPADTDTDSGGDTDSDTVPDDTDSGADTDSDTIPTDTDSGADTDTDTNPTDTDSDTDTIPGDTDSGSDTDTDTNPGDTDSGSDTDTDTVPDDTDTDTTPTDTDTDTTPYDTDTDTDTTPDDTDTDTDSDTDTDTTPDDTDTDVPVDTDSGGDTDTGDTDTGDTDAGRCGDGVLDPGEGCDDGNTLSGDGCSATCDVEGVCHDDLGVAGDFNVFVFDDLSGFPDVEGRAAAGGQVRARSFAVGFGDPGGLVLFGDTLDLHAGQVYGDAVYATAAVSDGVTYVGGTLSQGVPLDVPTEAATLTSTSAAWAALPANGQTLVDSFPPVSLVHLVGTDPVHDVFDLDASVLASTVALSIDVPPGADVLINVRGAVVVARNFGLGLNGVDADGVMWNLPEATSLTLQGVGWRGSILAPHADVVFDNGQMYGTLVARSATGTGEYHRALWTGTAPCPPTPVPPLPAPPPTLRDTYDVDDTGAGCTLPTAWWAAHHADAAPTDALPWPLPSGTVLCGETWLSWMQRTDASATTALGRAWIAATLNRTQADAPARVRDALDAAAARLATCVSDAGDGATAHAWTVTLARYNDGALGPGTCDPLP